MISLDIAPSLANIKERSNAFEPVDAFLKGRNAGFQNAQQQNALAQIQRQNEARTFAPAAMNGDKNALAQLAARDPAQAMDISKFAQTDPASVHQRAAALLYAAKDQGPQAWSAAVNQIGQMTGQAPDAFESDYNNREAVVGKFMSLPDMIAQRQGDRSYGLQKAGIDLQTKTLDNSIHNQDRNFGLDTYKAGVEASKINGDPYSMVSVPMPPGFSGANSGGVEQVGAYPGGDGITTADKGGTFVPTPPGGSVVQPPNAKVDFRTLPAVTLGQDGKPDPASQKAFMDKLSSNPIVANEIKMATDYMLPISQFSKRANSSATFAAIARQYDPTFDPSQYVQRQSMQKSVNQGPFAQTINSAEKVIQHAAQYKDMFDALHNGNIQLANQIKNSLATALGMPAQTNAVILGQGIGTEFAKSMKGSGALDVGSIEEGQKATATASSPDQMVGALATIGHMVGSAVDPIAFSYNKVMGKPLNWASPNTIAAMKKIGLDPAVFGDTTTNSNGPAAPAVKTPDGWTIEAQ